MSCVFFFSEAEVVSEFSDEDVTDGFLCMQGGGVGMCM